MQNLEHTPEQMVARRGEQFHADSQSIRAVCYLLNGQRCEEWLPSGEWIIDGLCNITADRDSVEMRPALIVYRRGRPGVYYISPDAV